MRNQTGLGVVTATLLLAACTSGGSEPAPESTATDDGELRAGTTYNGSGDSKTTSPIKHVIVIIGKNRTFDHLFATYKPKAGQTVDNLLSKGIVNEDGSPGPNFALVTQYTAIDSNPCRTSSPGSRPPSAPAATASRRPPP